MGDNIEQPATQTATEQPPAPKEFLTTEELLLKLPVCRKTLFSYCAKGKLPSVKLGRRVLFHWPSVQAALIRQQRGGGA